MNPRDPGYDCDKWSRAVIKGLLQWGFNTLDVNV